MKKITFLIAVLTILFSCTKKTDNVQLEPVNEETTGQKKNIIFLIGDGMGLAQISGARTVNNDQLNILRCEYIGIQSTHAADEYVTDSGASGTAMSCGQKTNHYTVGVDVDGNPLTTILEMAENNDLSTGLITTSHIAHATPAVFYAHNTDRFDYESVAYELISKDVDFFMGGGQKYFDQRTDELNLIDSLIAKEYQVVNNLSQISGDKKVACLISEDHPPSYTEGRGDVLPNSVEIALNRLKKNDNGFFMMVEGAQIDWACENNEQDYLIAEMLDFDNAVGKALDFAESDGNTLVVITGDHETGGYALVDGDLDANTVAGEFVTFHHTGTMIPVFAFGPGAEEFSGVYENTQIFYKFKQYFDFN
ncbi:MAG: hypothetical protein B6D61_06185 [Bacteroidetes bacterium 4484_249]|nr:MAG: hypothetical protein B6D61_06185 [Bacteroidetes bacterium 4484_249]